jgi:hypothetical protein
MFGSLFAIYSAKKVVIVDLLGSHRAQRNSAEKINEKPKDLGFCSLPWGTLKKIGHVPNYVLVPNNVNGCFFSLLVSVRTFPVLLATG